MSLNNRFQPRGNVQSPPGAGSNPVVWGMASAASLAFQAANLAALQQTEDFISNFQLFDKNGRIDPRTEGIKDLLVAQTLQITTADLVAANVPASDYQLFLSPNQINWITTLAAVKATAATYM
jgi:hypothetical protein